MPPVSAESDRWMFTREELASTPSRREGLDAAKETQFRFDGCSFISSAGQKLNVPQHTIATAQVYFHRFYMYRSFLKYEKKEMASCCLFLAGKVEDTPKRLTDILGVSYFLERRGPSVRKEDLVLDPKSEAFWNRKNKLLDNERTLLQTLGFDLEVEHPYNKMLEKCRILDSSRPVAQLAWNLINDSLRGTTICLEVGPDLVSTAVIRLAAQEKEYEAQIRKPTDGREWWQAITKTPKNVSKDVMERTMHIVKSMFSNSSNSDKGNAVKRTASTLSLEDYRRKKHRPTDNVKNESVSSAPSRKPVHTPNTEDGRQGNKEAEATKAATPPK